MPIFCEPPARFSITIGWPSAAENFRAVSRATASSPPPAAIGTTRLTGRPGNASSATAGAVTASNSATAIVPAFIALPPATRICCDERSASAAWSEAVFDGRRLSSTASVTLHALDEAVVHRLPAAVLGDPAPAAAFPGHDVAAILQGARAANLVVEVELCASRMN